MEYIIYLTYECNLSCKYCLAKKVVFNKQLKKKVMTDAILDNVVSYIDNDILVNNAENNCIVFYGGEPTLQPLLIEKIIKKTQHIKDLKYCIYSNGTYLDAIYSVVGFIDTVLISLDGDDNLSRNNKGNNFEPTVIKNNVLKMKTNFGTKFIARLTVEENMDLYESVMNVLKICDCVYWQIVNKDYFDNADLFLSKYKLNIRLLFEYWLKNFKNGIVIKLIPILHVVSTLLDLNTNSDGFNCGSGKELIAIDIEGNIYNCDEYIGQENKIIGNVSSNIRIKLDGITCEHIYKECKTCDYKKICSGRCRKMLETCPDNLISIYCKSTELLISEVIENYDEINNVLKVFPSLIANFSTSYSTEKIP